MNHFLLKVIRWLIRYDIVIIGFLVAGSFFLIRHVPYLQIHTDNEILLDKSGRAFLEYHDYVREFGSDRMIAVVFDGDIYQAERLGVMDVFTQRVQLIEGVQDVVSLTTAEGFHKSLWSLRMFDIYETWKTERKDMAWFRQALATNHFMSHNLVAADGTAGLAFVVLDEDIDEKDRDRVVFAFDDIVGQLAGGRVMMAGVPVEETLFLNNIKSDQKKLVPLIFLFLALMCLVFFRGKAALIASLGSILLTILWTQGTVVAMGSSINPITSLLSPVVMVISLAHVVHILNHLSEHGRVNSDNVIDVLTDVVARVGVPSFMAAVTTSVGFFSLLANGNPAIREFGFFAGIASFYSLVISFGLSVVAVKHLGVKGDGVRVVFPQGILNVLSKGVNRFSGSLCLVSLLIAFALLAGLPRLQVDTKLLNYIRDKDQMIKAVDLLDRKFHGSNSLEVIVRLREGTFFDPKAFALLRDISATLAGVEPIREVNGFDDLVMNLHQVLERDDDAPLPSAKRLALFQRKISESSHDVIYHFVNREFNAARLNCLIKNSSTREILQARRQASAVLDAMVSDRWNYQITGRDYLFADMSDVLVKGQMMSMLWAGVPIGLIVFLSLMSFPLWVLGMISMALPVAMTFGVMGWCGIPLCTATTMISSVAMGLMVDDTIHFLYRYKRMISVPGACAAEAIGKTLTLTGRAIILTSLILIGGFSVGISGAVIPTVHFSVLMGVVALLSLGVNIIFLPAWLKLTCWK